MCVEKIQKILLASVLGIVLMLIGTDSLKLALMLQVIVIVMLMMSAFSGFCFITKVLSSEFPSCNDKDKEDKK
jgi:hypothetical protein